MTCNPFGADVGEEPALVGETENTDLGFGPEGPDEELDPEGVATEDDILEVYINGFGPIGR